jgi:hypothetical protein
METDNPPFVTADASGPKHLNMKLTGELGAGADLLDRLDGFSDRAQGRRRQHEGHRRGGAGRWHDAHAGGAGA